MLHASSSHAKKANQILFFGDATGGCAVGMQRQDSSVTDRRDIKGGKEQQVGENMDHTGGKLGQITSKYIYMDGFQHWLNRIVKWRFEVFLTKEYDCKHGGENPRRGFAPFEYTTHFQMCKSTILEFDCEGGLPELTKTCSRPLSRLPSVHARLCAASFFVAFFFLKPLNIKYFCSLWSLT